MTVLVEPFGRDCLGNSTGYRVAEYGPHGFFQVHKTFVADIYEPGSHDRAKAEAEQFRSKLAGRLQ